MTWPQVDRIIIAGAGPSLRGVPKEAVKNSGALIIAVNGALDWLGYAHYWFTLDPSTANHARMAKPIAGVRYVAAVPSGTDLPAHVHRLRRVEGPLFGRARAPGGLASDPDTINTGNSAFGALNLAYHMRPRRIAILGVDGTLEQRVDGGYPGCLDHLPALFASATHQLSRAGAAVRMGSETSEVACFPRTNPREALSWLR